MIKKIAKNDLSFFKRNPDVVYLDSAATALTFERYFTSLAACAAEGFTTVHRGAHQFSDKTTVAYENARMQFADAHNVFPQEIVFTSGTTGACNQVAWSWGMQHLKAGDEVLVSVFEHHSSYLPWLRVAQEKGAAIRWVYPDAQILAWQLDDFVFSPQAKVLVVAAYSNVCGPVWQSKELLKQVIQKAHENNVCVVLDGAQQAPFEMVDLRELNPDFYMYSAHKMCGPQGVGVLFVNQATQSQLSPALVGGGTVRFVMADDAEFRDDARAFEAGTPPVLPIIAWSNVREWYAAQIDTKLQQQQLAELMSMVIDEASSVSGVRVLGNEVLLRSAGHLISLVVDDVHAHDIADLLNDQNIIVRAGLMCAQPLHEFLGVSASLRVSVHWYSTHEDIKQFCSVFKTAVDRLRRV